MSDLISAVPPNDPDHDAVVDYSLIGVSFLPIAGQPIAELVRGSIARREAERQYDFNVKVATALDALVDRSVWTVESVLDSDDFMAAVSKGSRAAAETASDAKRERLAAAAAMSGPWFDMEPTRKMQFLDMVTRYEDIHVLLLTYFRDPRAWLAMNSNWQPGRYMTAGISTMLGEYVFADAPSWQEVVGPVLAEFVADGVAQVPINTTMSESGLLEPRTYPRGNDFLDYIHTIVNRTSS